MARSRRRFTASLLTASMRSAAQELGTTWPSLRKAFQRHGLGMPARNPEAIRQRAIAPAHKRTGQAATPPLDPVFLALNPGALPARERSPAASSTSGSAATSSTPPWGQRGGGAVQRKPRASTNHPGLGDHPPRRPRPPAGRPTRQPLRTPPCRSHDPVPAIPGAGDGGRCRLTFAGPSRLISSSGSTPGAVGL